MRTRPTPPPIECERLRSWLLQAACCDDAVVDSLLDQRLGDVLELVRAVREGSGSATEALDDAGAWTDAVRELVREQLDRPDLSLAGAARALAVSARTLQRRLADEGTSWSAEVDAARRERAALLLRQGTTAEVTAARLGYSDSRALRRALHRWSGACDAKGPEIGAQGPPAARGQLP
jgi:AraC-like DNA-binding protein